MNTLVDLVQFFVAEGIETADELRGWLIKPGNVERLKGIKGIGNKTADYFKILTGIPTSAIDRHLYSFMAQAGVEVSGYEEAQGIIRETAVWLGTDERTLDYSIWTYMSEQMGR
jgi:thermostable 8-oxoguanine DNA glycosylase